MNRSNRSNDDPRQDAATATATPLRDAVAAGSASAAVKVFMPAVLFSGTQRSWRGSHRCSEFPGIDLLPGARVAADEESAARAAKHLGVLDPGRQRILIAQSARRDQQAARTGNLRSDGARCSNA